MPVTDDDIQEIIERNEAGVADLMEVYERVETAYAAAASAQVQQVTVSSHT